MNNPCPRLPIPGDLDNEQCSCCGSEFPVGTRHEGCRNLATPMIILAVFGIVAILAMLARALS